VGFDEDGDARRAASQSSVDNHQAQHAVVGASERAAGPGGASGRGLCLAALLVEPWVRGVGFELSEDNCAIVRWRGRYMQGAEEAYRAQQAARSMAKCYLAGEGRAILPAKDFVLPSTNVFFVRISLGGSQRLSKILDNFSKLSMHSTLALWRVHRI
jgi:hypothetical protein